jgi:DNA-directed RNA polymerase subunit M/transcription elongation factor TFIIS
MHFCNKCDNMYYIKIRDDDTNKLIYYCRSCGNEEDKQSDMDTCILRTDVKQNQVKFTHVVNEYTKQDPTLPRITTIRCPNQECPSNSEKSGDQEIIYIRYDDVSVKYMYLCSKCDTMWKTDNNTF